MAQARGSTPSAASNKGADVGGASPRDIFEAGNPEAALNILVENSGRRREANKDHHEKAQQQKPAPGEEAPRPVSAPFNTLQEEYNSVILTALISDPPTNDASMLMDQMEIMQQALKDSKSGTTTSSVKTEREELIVAHNRAVSFLASGDVQDGIRTAWKMLRPILLKCRTPNKPPDELLKLACRTGFLLVDCLLALWPNRYHYPEQVFGMETISEPKLDINIIVTWLTDMIIDGELGDKDPQLKFLLGIYRSRVDFHERDKQNKIPEANIRSARKELKQAMEVFQHKLRAVSNDSGSLASSSYSEDLNSGPGGNQGSNRSGGGAKSPTPLSMSNSSGGNNSNMPKLVQYQNQAVLNLKANAEQLKGNMKKSLILCAEAKGAEDGSDDNESGGKNNYYEAIHQNNLGIVYETGGKPYLALHAFSKALRLARLAAHDDPNTIGSDPNAVSAPLFEKDGTARPDVTLTVLHNTAFSSLKAGNYFGAYKCYAILLREGCVTWGPNARVWFRMAEACIGLDNQRKKEMNTPKCSKLDIDGVTRGILVGRNNVSEEDSWGFDRVTGMPTFGTAEDLEEVQKKPLLRARHALEIAVDLFGDRDGPGQDIAKLSARVSLSYVLLELREYTLALTYAEMALKIIPDYESDPLMDAACTTMLKRLEATARMYASEASAIQGQVVESMKFIAGDGQKDAIDRLASDLAGVTLETAATDPKAKVRLAKAQTMVRCSASAASACLGNLGASKQLALSAQAMENSYSVSRDRSSARRALLYNMLRDGNHNAALSLLRSSR